MTDSSAVARTVTFYDGRAMTLPDPTERTTTEPPPLDPTPPSPPPSATPPSATPPSPPPTTPPVPAWAPPPADHGRGLSLIVGVIILIVGAWFFATRTLGLDLPDLDWDQLWPVILILIGSWIVYASVRRAR